MFGDNPIRGLFTGDGSELEVKSIFATIQGEGPFAGTPSVFIRLGGCNLDCGFCDTEFEDFQKESVHSIVEKVKLLSLESIKLVVITGGEPFRQPIEKLCDELLETGYKIQIETNGTIYRKIDDRVNIVCSPKASKTGYSRLRSDLLSRLGAIKFLISKYHKYYDTVPDVGQSECKKTIKIYVQPMDEYDEEKNKANADLTVEIAKAKGYNLSVQIHKYMGIE